MGRDNTDTLYLKRGYNAVSFDANFGSPLKVSGLRCRTGFDLDKDALADIVVCSSETELVTERIMRWFLLQQGLSRADIPADQYIDQKDQVYSVPVSLNPQELEAFQKRFSDVSQSGMKQLKDFNAALRKTEIRVNSFAARGGHVHGFDLYFKNSERESVKIEFEEVDNGQTPWPEYVPGGPRWPQAEHVSAFTLSTWPGTTVYVKDPTHFKLIQGDLDSLYKGAYIAIHQPPLEEEMTEYRDNVGERIGSVYWSD